MVVKSLTILVAASDVFFFAKILKPLKQSSFMSAVSMEYLECVRVCLYTVASRYIQTLISHCAPIRDFENDLLCSV